MDYFLLILASILTGFINTLAGSGSLIMMPLLMWMGLPADVANGTNRVAVLFQSFVGVGTYLRSGKIIIGRAWWLIVPCVIGAMAGAYIATIASAATIKSFLGVLMIVMLGIILLQPGKWIREFQAADSITYEKRPLVLVLMFIIGFYGGFIQAGVGIFLLACIVMLVNYTITYANAIKLVVVLFYAVPVLIIFIIKDQVDWPLGIITALGQGVGAYVGALFATRYPKANLWTYRLLIVVLVITILQFYHVPTRAYELFIHLF